MDPKYDKVVGDQKPFISETEFCGRSIKPLSSRFKRMLLPSKGSSEIAILVSGMFPAETASRHCAS
jgi:hypothetical protein